MSNQFQHWVDLDLTDRRRLLQALIGQRFGPEPETRIDEIRSERSAYMQRYCRLARIKPAHTVLELGSGCGFGTRVLAQKAARVFACDISPAFLSLAREELSDLEHVEYFQVGNRDLSVIADESVDRIVSVSVFIHFNLYDMFAYFQEFDRVLAPGGRVVIDFADAHRLHGLTSRAALREQFLEQEHWYRENPENLPALMQWNSAAGVCNVAHLAGLRKVRRWGSRLVLAKGK